MLAASLILCASAGPAASSPASGPAQATPEVVPERQAELRAWFGGLGEAIARRKVYPAAVKARATEAGTPAPTGRVVLAFVLDRSGALASLSVSESSGIPEFDDAAMRMMREAAPFPPPPAWVRDDQLKFAVPILFRSGR